MFGAAKLTGRFWFRKTWTGKLVLLVEEERTAWLGRGGLIKLRWRDARLLDLAEAPMRPLMALERTYRAGHGAEPERMLRAVDPSGKRGAVAAPLGNAANA